MAILDDTEEARRTKARNRKEDVSSGKRLSVVQYVDQQASHHSEHACRRFTSIWAPGVVDGLTEHSRHEVPARAILGGRVFPPPVRRRPQTLR